MSEPVVTKTYFITDKEDNEFPEAFVNSTNPRSIEVQCCHFRYNHNGSEPKLTMHCSFVQSDPYLDKATITTNETRTKFKTYLYKGCQDTFKIWFSGGKTINEPEEYILTQDPHKFIDEIFQWKYFTDTPAYVITDAIMKYQFRLATPADEPITQEEIDHIQNLYTMLLIDNNPDLTAVLAAIQPIINQLNALYTKDSGAWLLSLLQAVVEYEERWDEWDSIASMLTETRAFALVKSKFPEQLKHALLILYLSYDVEYNNLITALEADGINTKSNAQIMFAALQSHLFEESDRIPTFAFQLTYEEFSVIFPIIEILNNRDLVAYEIADLKDCINDVLRYYIRNPSEDVDDAELALLQALKEFNEINNDVFKPCWWDHEETLYPHFVYYILGRLNWEQNRVPTVTPKILTDELTVGFVTRRTYKWTYTDPAIGVFDVTQQENYYDPKNIPHKFLAEFMLIY